MDFKNGFILKCYRHETGDSIKVHASIDKTGSNEALIRCLSYTQLNEKYPGSESFTKY